MDRGLSLRLKSPVCMAIFVGCFTVVMLTFAAFIIYTTVLYTQWTSPVSGMNTVFMADTYGDSITAMGANYGSMTSAAADNMQHNNYQPYLYHYLRTRSIEGMLRNFGIGGQLVPTICDRLRYAPTVMPNIILMAGTNDIFSGVASSNITHTIEYVTSQFVDVTSKLKNRQFFVCSLPPLGTNYPQQAHAVLRVNEAIQEFTRVTNNTVLCDIHAHLTDTQRLFFQNPRLTLDGIHLTRQGNEILGQAIGACIVRHHYRWQTCK